MSGVTMSGRDGRRLFERARIVTAALAFMASAASVQAAEPAPDMSLYDCIRNDGETARGDDLIADEFAIVSIGRFDGLIVNLAHPLTGTRASCQLRTEPPK